MSFCGVSGLDRSFLTRLLLVAAIPLALMGGARSGIDRPRQINQKRHFLLGEKQSASLGAAFDLVHGAERCLK
jgi:hypothetical protein